MEDQTLSPTPPIDSPVKGRKVSLVWVIALIAVLGAVGGVMFGQSVVNRPAKVVLAAASSTTIVVVTPAPETSTTTSLAVVPVAQVVAVPTSTVVEHVPLPNEVRGIYWTGWTAGSSRVNALLTYMASSHLNSVVIDLKLDDGTLSFVPRDPTLQEIAPKYPAIRDLDALLKRLKDKGVYRIARIAVMRDAVFGKLHPDVVLRYADGGVWHDKTGMAWLDPASRKVSDHAVALAHEAFARGFDEVQFDYVRFASDGNLSAIRYPVYDGKESKAEVMQKFFARVGGALRAEHIPVSFDLFGLTFWSEDGLGIGQRLSDVYPNADAVSPMVYPSHYARGFQGFANPALYPYEVVKRSLVKGIETLQQVDPNVDPVAARKKFRPWIQDFNMGAVYDASKVQAQIKAARDAGASGWMIWNPRNVYTPINYLK